MQRSLILLFFFGCLYLQGFCQHDLFAEHKKDRIKVGAEQTDIYIGMLQGKSVALVVNQTSRIGTRLLPDTLKDLGVNITKIFAPEHGFRGKADAGATIDNAVDAKTGIAVVSLYGKKLRPSADDLKDVDVVIFDIQDVGCRFYTFLSTLHYLMEACAENDKTLIVLDRPNPNGYYVDGPVLDMKFKSFVGVSRLPVVYGLTLGEYAKLAKGERWIANADKLTLRVIPCENYDHKIFYKLPVSPSPNLQNERAVFLYPSLCFFEGTNISVGRGTDFPFQVIGAPDIAMDSSDFTFMPVSKPGATDPPDKDQVCKGYDLRNPDRSLNTEAKGINLKYLLRMYKLTPDKDKFFSRPDFFDKLAGTDELRKQIIDGKSDSEIRSSWQAALQEYKTLRKKYLIYRDFE